MGIWSKVQYAVEHLTYFELMWHDFDQTDGVSEILATDIFKKNPGRSFFSIEKCYFLLYHFY